MNYFEDFLDMIDSEHLNDFVKFATGNEKTEKAINELNKSIEHDKVLSDKIANCLALQQELWFNVGWSTGWSAGAATLAKFAGFDSPRVDTIAKTMNFNSD